MFNSTFKRTALAAAIAMTVSGAALAQDTSSSIRGVVTAESGSIISGATIQLRDERTGSVKTLTTNAQGTFSSRGLPVGGPYTLMVKGPNGQSQVIENVYLTLGDSETVNVVLEPQDIETISVTVRRQLMRCTAVIAQRQTSILQTCKTRRPLTVT